MAMLQRVLHAIKPVETKSAVLSPLWGLDAFVAPTTLSGTTVNAQTAMQCPMVKVCISTIADALATLPVHIFERVDGAKQRADEHPAFALVHRDANAWTSASAFRALMARNALLHGNAFAVVSRVAGRPVELNRVSPTAVSVEISMFGEPTYRIRLQDGGELVLDYTDVMHVTSGTRADDGVTGVSPVQLARESIGLCIVMQNTASSVFKNHARPGGYVKVPQTLGDEAAGRMSASLNATLSGANVGRTMVLEDGADFVPIQQGFRDNEFGALWSQANIQVCRAFGVPPSLAYEMERATWGNAVEMRQAFIDFTLAPHLKEFEAAYRRALLSDAERATHIVEFSLDEFLKGDLTARATAYSTLISAHVLTPNEARAKENLPALPGGDELVNPFTTSTQAPALPAQPQVETQ